MQASVEQFVEGLRSELADLQAECSCAEAELEQLKRDKQKNEKEVAAEQRCRKEINSKMMDAESEIRKLKNANDIEKLPNIAALEEDEDKVREDVEKLSEKIEGMTKKLEEAESEQSVAKAEFDAALEKRTSSREAGQQLQERYN